jgi:hypothetical protein
MNLTSNISVATNIAAPMMPAMITCTGVILAKSASLSARLRTPKKDQNTVLNTRSGDAFPGLAGR